MKRISFLFLALITLSLACVVPANLNESARRRTLTNPADVGDVVEEPYAGAVFDPESRSATICARVISMGALNLHQAAHFLAEVVGHLEQDDLVEVLNQSDSKWWLVATDERRGYARSIYFEIVNCETEAE